MNEANKTELKTKEKINFIDIIYLSILLLFIIIIIIVFFYSTNFIIKNINKVFFTNQDSNVQALDKTKYSTLEKKLGLIDPTKNLDNTIPTQNITEIQKIIEPIKTIKLDKTLLNINIINAAKKAGVASTLSKSLEKAGYNKATTDDAKNTSIKTTIAIKKDKKEYEQSIMNIIKIVYPNIIPKINPENSNFDVVIIIGKQ